MKVNWQGVYPAVSTQFHADQSLDLDASQQMLDRLINEGVHGIIVCGTVGENCSLSATEKRQVLTAAKEVVQGRVPLISGVAETTTALAAGYTLHQRLAGQIVHGVDGIPRSLVAHSDSLGSLGDGSAFGDPGEQGDTLLAAEPLAIDSEPDRAVQLDGPILFLH